MMPQMHLTASGVAFEDEKKYHAKLSNSRVQVKATLQFVFIFAFCGE